MEQGIFTDFVEYRDLDLSDPADPVHGTIYVVDTNVLLNLYKFTRSTTDEVLGALRSMAEVLFVPHQVLAEFWKGLEEVRKGAHHREATGKISTGAESIRRELETWLTRTGLATDSGEGAEIVERQKQIAQLADELIEAVDRIQTEASAGEERIIPALEEAFEGRAGMALSAENRKKAIDEFKTRAESLIPPGFRDYQKRDEKADKTAGDFLIWRECLEVGKKRSKVDGRPLDLTLITNDLKDDWVRGRREDDAPLAHRILVREYADAAGGVFRIRTFRSLLDIANEHFGAQVSEASKVQVESRSQQPGNEWTALAVRGYLASLWNRDYFDQLRVLITAIAASEARVEPLSVVEAREIAGREKLSAFSSPYKTALQHHRVVDAGVDEPMISLVWDADGNYFELADVPLDTVLSELVDDDDYREMLEKAREWIQRRSGSHRETTGVDEADGV